MVDLPVLFIFSGKPWSIQAITMWLQQLNAVLYNIWTLDAVTILNYYIDVDVLGMLEET